MLRRLLIFSLLSFSFSCSTITTCHSQERDSMPSVVPSSHTILDLQCLLKDTSFNKAPTGVSTTFETEQHITGYVNTTNKDSNDYRIILFIPAIGKTQEFQVRGNKRFNIYGLDFVNGTTMCLQATSNKRRSPQPCIVPQTFADVSVRRLLPIAKTNDHLQQEITPKLEQKVTYNKTRYNLELPNIVVKGNRLKPLNRLNFQPDRGIPENSPLFEQAATLETLLYKWGLKFGYGWVYDDSINDSMYVYGIGSIRKNFFKPCEVMVDGDLVKGYAISEIPNIKPFEIRQIEYFLPSNYEMFGNLAGGVMPPIKGLYGDASGRGLLMIWLKSPSKYKNDTKEEQSFIVIKPLGYLP